MENMYVRWRLGTLLSIYLIGLHHAYGAVYNHNFRIVTGEGFLVKPTATSDYPIDSTSVKSEQFYIYNQNTATKVTASFGNLHTSQNVSYELNDYSNDDPLSSKVVNVDSDANVTAHLVQRTVTNTKPSLKVLIHSDRTLSSPPRCVHVYAKRRETETVSNYCILSNDNQIKRDDSVVCLVDVALPYEWWSSRDIDVYYHIKDLESCTTKSNSNPSHTLPTDVFYIGEVLLMFDDRHGARDISEDKNIVISLPDKPQEPGEQFTVTVKLHPGSTLRMFVIRLEMGDGLTLKSMSSADRDLWDVRFRRVGSSGSIAEVNAVTTENYQISHKTQEVIQCHFQVLKSTIKLQSPISWNIGYQPEAKNSLVEEAEFHEQTVTTSIQIAKSDEITNVVAVIKSHELVSLRRFTSEISAIPVWLYSVDKAGRVYTAHTNSECYSLRPSILQVSKLCDMIYLSGEGSDPGIVEVIFEYASIRHTLDIRVWYPDVKMFIKLSDNRLSAIKSWRVRPETNAVEHRDSDMQCSNLQYQTSDLQVYTKFYTVHQRKDVYMRGGKVEVFADITQYVRNLVQTSDRDVVRYEDGLLRAVSPGKAIVKIVSADDVQLAATDIRVTSSKTSVDRISGNFVSDINLVVSKGDQAGLLTASYTYERRLSDKLPEGVLELWVHFQDLQAVPLSSFDQTSYRLEIENETPTILALPSNDFKNRYITVRAVGSGQGVLKFTLYMDEACQKKSTRYLVIGYVYVESDVSKPAGLFVNDAAYKNEGIRRLLSPWSNNEKKVKPVKVSKVIAKKGKDSSASSSLLLDPQPVMDSSPSSGLSPLETGMFVLMGVLGVVASVFVSNCLVYMYRQNKREKESMSGSLGSEKIDSGWVWLNKTTLEENSIPTKPDQLLAQREFEKRCSRSDSLQSTRSKRSATGTYRGSECSVRITVNPRHALHMPDLSDSEEEEELYSSPESHESRPIIGIEEPELSDLGEDFSLHSASSLRSRRRQSDGSEASEDQSFIVHDSEEELDVPTTPRSLTQEQFDNMRESVA